ncbi:fumarate reductase/succinate dehydrogenase flavoprotein subunit [Actinoplanes couchii]|uniref:Succinate dehydrogenase flavoprotein subunit n=1 Tax=Actinoplanes couchii TaxID=403638 RepID=A0ABQ3X6G6_9ACTN|nr:fumarate reductase/succinate dehydrogenase flavoprotein subunit [Actinoplanes couchii]MDR6325217.1 succinate dehydrogenase / fumarate reductase flavoprotein subunit [Actinoplanes couchii]GID54079.1 succinate dehydrogenase flavoprotein subunit [Actinoplanes couchii]
MSDNKIERHLYDVVVIGAGGAGLRAAIEARLAGKRTAIISKSLFGKAHTVMAEGGAAAAMGNANSRDNWMVHFRDTMRGGKFLNNFRMAELHAKEAPERIWELETYGALFDRTKDGKISQRNFGGHEYPRLAHVGDRTGLELIRTLQQKIVSLQQEDFAATGSYDSRIRVFQETTITELMLDGDRVAGAFGYYRETGEFLLFEAPAVVLATGGVGRSYKVTSNSWEYTGDGHALALRAGATLINMEFLQFHPTGMVWPPSVKGILVTESVRGDGGVLRNSDNKRFMFDYVPDVFRKQYAETEEEADRWYADPDNNRRPPELLPRDEVARAINSEVKAGRGSPAGGVFLDVSTRLPAEQIIRRLPSMHHQFKELADVDITKEPMEVGPTCHYVMGGVEVDPDTGAAFGRVQGLFAAGEVSGGMHGSNRLGGNSLSDLLVFGKRAGEHASAYVDTLQVRPRPAKVDVAAAVEVALAPLVRAAASSTGSSADSSTGSSADSSTGSSADSSAAPSADSSAGSSTASSAASSAGSLIAENPYTLQQDLQAVMGDLVGIIRREGELTDALKRLHELRARVANVGATGGRRYNPGWHLALDLRNMLVVSECTARAALEREESRGGHTREDFPAMNPTWRRINLVCSLSFGEVHLEHKPVPAMRAELLALFERSELSKYLTDEELAEVEEQ